MRKNVLRLLHKGILSVSLAVASMFFCGNVNAQTGASNDVQKAAAEKLIQDFMASGGEAGVGFTVNVTIDPTQKDGEKDKFTYTKNGSSLEITATNGVAACRGFYDFVKSNAAGISSWSANRFDANAATSGTVSNKTVTSAYRDHQYFNVVTYGYSTPYWDKERWDQEIMWMALHGIDMPLMLVGSEGIYFDTFTKDFNVPAEGVHNWEVGPAHLPWMRMGNLAGSKFDGPLDDHWYNQQKELAHHILKRMYELGMRPILPAFGGFVPPAFETANPDCGKLTHTGWDWVIARNEYNTRLNPNNEYFVRVGQKFIERWEAEFSKSYPGMKYYLSDSFNEMAVPGATELEVYGREIYKSINEASKEHNPNAERVWVTQGWEFGYGSGKWTNGTSRDQKFKALVGSVPTDRFMVLYMSPEYGGYNNAKWATDYDGFGGWEWINTMLPNMGGKNFWTGCLEDYANTFPQKMASTNTRNLKGWGMTMEGIEYNELLYELIADMGWESMSNGHSVDAWVLKYGNARYGTEAYSQKIKDLHNVLRQNVYRSYKDHQTFGWQGYNRKSGYYTPGNIDYLTKTFYSGMETFFSEANIDELKQKPLSKTLRADLIEFATFYAAARVESINKRIVTAANMNKKDEANKLLADLEKVMYNMDRALSAHPIYDLQKWEDKAKKAAGENPELQKKYVRDARSIVSTWHSGHGEGADAHEAVNDYAGRIWAGLIRGYYYPRLKAELQDLIEKRPRTNLRTIENNFVSTTDSINLLPVLMQNEQGEWVAETVENALAAASDETLLTFLKELVDDAQEAGKYVVPMDKLQFSNAETGSHWYAIHAQNENYQERVFTSTGTQTDLKTSFGVQDLAANDAQYWRFILYADSTIRLENRNGQSLMFENNSYRTTLVNVGTDITFLHDSIDNNRFAFKLVGASNYMNYDGNLKTAAAKNNDGTFVTNSTWTLESADAKVNEVSRNSDYDRMRQRVSGFGTSVWGSEELYGEKGQPKNAEALNTMIEHLRTRDAHDPLLTYSQFVDSIYGKKLAECFHVPAENTMAFKLFDLIMSAMTLTPSEIHTEATATFRAAMIAAQQTVATGTEEECTAQVATLREAINAYYEGIAPQKVTSTAKIAAGNKYVLKNVSANRNACLFEDANSGFLHITSDVSRELTINPGFVFTLVAGETEGTYKLRANSGKYIPVISHVTTTNQAGANVNSAQDGDSFTFTYQTANNKSYWTIKSSGNAGNYLYNFGPGTNGGRLILGNEGKIADGCQFELYLVSENPAFTPTTNWSASDWTNADFGTAVSGAASKTNFYSACYYDTQVEVTEENSTVSSTITYTGGSHAQNTYGIELIGTEGQVVKSYFNQSGDRGFCGSSPNHQMTYSVSDVPAGNYTLRVWSSASRGNETMTANGTIVNSINSAAGSTINWTPNSWKIDNTAIPASLKTNDMPKVGLKLNQDGKQFRYYRYIDKTVTVKEATKLTAAFSTTDNTKLIELIGLEVLKGETVLEADSTYDGHYCARGSRIEGDSLYQVSLPERGTYTVRLWASYVNSELPTTGKIEYTIDMPSVRVVARMKELAAAATNENKPVVSTDWASSETEGKVYKFNGSNQYFGAIDNADVAEALMGGRMVTVAAWVYGTPAGDRCIFGYGEGGNGVKFMMQNGTTFKTTTKSRKDFDAQAVAGMNSDGWNLVAFAFPGKASDIDDLYYYTTDINDNQWKKTGAASFTMNDAAQPKCAIGSGNQDSWREGFSGLMSNLTVIESAEALTNTEIAMLVGEKPQEVVPDSAVSVIYQFTIDSVVVASEIHPVELGTEYPEFTSTLPFGVAYPAKPEGTINEYGTINVELEWNLPFKHEKSIETATGWYQLRVNPQGKNNSLFYDATQNPNMKAVDGAVSDPKQEKYLWTIVGDPFNGFTIYNKLAGKELAVQNSNPCKVTAEGVNTKFWLEAGYQEREGQFSIVDPAISGSSKYLNGNYTLARYSKDGGSTFAITRILPVDGDVNADGKVDKKDVEDLVKHINASESTIWPDVDNSKKVSIKDLTELIQKLLNVRSAE